PSCHRPLPARTRSAMVGKARRQRLHRPAPRLTDPAGPGPGPGPGGWSDWDFSSSDIFSGLNIDPNTLVKKLDLDSRSIISSRTGLEEKPILSKKEKMKLRKERWLQKIESVKLAKQKQKAEAKRKATPVVGDMQPLMEALPELSDLTAGARDRKPPKRYVSAAFFLFLLSSFPTAFLPCAFQVPKAAPALPARPLLHLSRCLYYNLYCCLA
uniref:SLX9 ribosome biosis factor n=1 Tax=Anas platyrhynchos platyrhynchos TaxID=8840 RepID=A0A493T8U0_ANAPP